MQHVREQTLLLLAGLAFCVWAKADAQLFITYSSALVGLSGAFMWGNRGEHASAAAAGTPLSTPPAPTPPTP